MSENYAPEGVGYAPSKDFRSKKYKQQDTGALRAGRIPPQAVEMEQAVLGALLLEKDALNKIVDVVRPEMFYKESHKLVYQGAIHLFQNSEPIDILTVKNYLSQQGELEAAGGVYYLTELTSKVASAANIEYHARVIAQKYLMREMIKIGDGMVRDAYDETTDVFDLLDKTEQDLFSLSETNLRRSAQSMSDLVLKTLVKLEELQGQEGGITGVATGFTALDQMTSGFHPADLVIIAARPAMGKTAFTLTFARNAAVRNGTPVAFFSLEMDATQLVQRLLCAEAEIDAQKVRTGRLERYEWEQLTNRIGNLSKAPLYIDDTPALSIMDLRAKGRRLKAEKNIGMIVIDYLQLMTGNVSKGGNREQEIAGISRSLKELAKELSIPIIALSQLSRAVETRGGDKKPMLSDLRESGSIEQDADMVMFLYRPEYYGLTTYEDGTSTQGVAEVIIAKQRSGPVGDVKLQFISKFAKFANLNDHQNEAAHPGMENGMPGLPNIQPNTITRPSRMNEEAADEGDFNFPF
ncbi:MAG TPA: replicative DNA helicase [Bacteroidetes bacterium]|nr:replicative DNA helicase [Bacteroidota bacterium]